MKIISLHIVREAVLYVSRLSTNHLASSLSATLPVHAASIDRIYRKIFVLPAVRNACYFTNQWECFSQCRPSYCVNYKIFFKHPHCKDTWADQLDPQKPICVECQHDAMNRHGKCKGQGVFGDVTLWEAVDLKSCYGGWLKIGPKIPDCKCENKDFNNFIFI